MELFTTRRPSVEMTLENFQPRDEHGAALQMAKLIAEKGTAAATDGPLYVYGGPSSGKTHLLSGIANGSASGKVLFINAADLKADYERARALGVTVDRVKQLMEPDILLLDDIDLCLDDPETLTDVFCVIYLRIRADRAVVVGAHVPPTSLAGADPRLISLLGSGNCVGLD